MKRVIRVFHPGVLPALPQMEMAILWLAMAYTLWYLDIIQSGWVAALFVSLWVARLARAIYLATHETFVVPMTMGVQEIEDDNHPEGG